MNRFAHLSQRLFNCPLVIHPRKAEVVIASLAERLGITRIVQLDGRELDIGVALDEGDDFASARDNGGAGYELIGGVAVIEVSGTLVHKLGTLRPYSGMTGYDGIRQNLLMALTDRQVRGIALEIDSPGGEVSGCFDLVDLIYRMRGDKPIWSILSENAYSGAYAIASATDRIVVPRTGGTGSVGVICMHVDMSKALTGAGFNVTFLQYGDRKADGHPEIPLSPEARAAFQSDIDAMGVLFDETVARNRGLAASAVKSLQAGTFMGSAGVTAGLADAVMAPDAAFRALLESLA
jgi:signal peptide peptidase SppA